MMTCGLDGMCNGMGACRRYPANTVCGADSCTGSTAMLAARCTAAGTCGTPMLQNCSPYVCNATSTTCRTSCATTADCAAGFTCIGSICAKKPNGSTCAMANECESNYCQQGVCCNTGCAGTCMACNLATTMGTCSPIAPGQPPVVATQCPMMASTSCGTDGMCNGAGACRNYAAGTACGGAELHGVDAVVGADLRRGGRVPAADHELVYARTPARRRAPRAGRSCAATQRVRHGQHVRGHELRQDSDRRSVSVGRGLGLRVRLLRAGRVLQFGACTGTCMTCSTGTCSPGLGAAPRRSSPASALSQRRRPAVTTGRATAPARAANTCWGRSAWRASCTGSTYKPPQLCDGVGACAAATTQSCMAFQCDTTAGICRNTCSMDAQCVAPNICNGTTCSLKPIGATCTARGRVQLRLLRAGPLLRQRVQRHVQDVRAGDRARHLLERARRSRARRRQPVCRPRRRRPAASKACATARGLAATGRRARSVLPGSCTGSTLIPARTCDGAGACRTVTSTLCDPYQCASATACKTTCTAPDHGHGLRGAEQLRQRQLRQAAHRGGVRDEQPVQLELLRAGGVLHDRVRRDVRVVRSDGLGRHVHLGPRRPGSAEPVRRSGRGDVRYRRHRATAAARAGVTRPASPASRRAVRTPPTCSRRRPATRAAPA